jgi:hypothetical protein
MKSIIKKTLLYGLAFMGIYCALYVVTWIAASAGLIKNVEFGYYKGFNVARHAFEKCGCVEKIEYSYVNKDVFLEEFQYRITTKSGRIVQLSFDASNMDVDQVCYAPAGISVLHPAYKGDKRYSPEFLSELLKDKGVRIRNLNDILCNIDQLEEIVRTTQADEKVKSEDDPYVWDYLRIEFPTEKDLEDDEWTNVKDMDVADYGEGLVSWSYGR